MVSAAPVEGSEERLLARFVFVVMNDRTDVANSGSFIGKIPQFVQQVRAETNKVVWPTSRETMMTAVMVIIMTTLLGFFFFAVDAVFGRIVHALLQLAV